MARKPLFTQKRSVLWAQGGAPHGPGQRIYRRPWIGGGTGSTPELGPAQIFNAPLINSAIPSVANDPAYTFARTSIATFRDHESLIKNVISGELRFRRCRRVQNLANDSEDYSLTSWTEFGSGTITDNTTFGRIEGLATGSAVDRAELDDTQFNTTVIFAREFIISFEARALSGEAGQTVSTRTRSKTGGVGNQFTNITLGADWQRYSLPVYTGVDATSTGFRFDFNGINNDATGLDVRNYQIEEVTGQTVQIASEYVDIGQGTDHGSNVDGVKYFTTENDNNSVDGTTRVLTEATGSAISDAILAGYLEEPQKTNGEQNSEDFSAWATVATPIITVDNILAPDGSQTGDTVQDDDAANFEFIRGTAVAVSANSTRTASIFIKQDAIPSSTRFCMLRLRFTGSTTANADVTIDTSTGQTASRITGGGNPTIVSFGSELWQCPSAIGNFYRIWITATDTDSNTSVNLEFLPAAGAGILSSSYTTTAVGSVGCWGAQNEDGDLTSYIRTAGGAVTRNKDSLQYNSSNILDDEGTLSFNFTPSVDTVDYQLSSNQALIAPKNAVGDLVHIQGSSGKIRSSDGTTNIGGVSMPNLVRNVLAKIASRWSNVNGTFELRQATTEVSAAFDGSLNKGPILWVGGSSGSACNGAIKNLIIWNGPLDDATYQGLTT